MDVKHLKYGHNIYFLKLKETGNDCILHECKSLHTCLLQGRHGSAVPSTSCLNESGVGKVEAHKGGG